MALETKPFRNLPQLPNGTSVANNIKLTDCLPFQHTDINEGVNSFNKITMGQMLCEPVATAGDISGNTYFATCSNFPDFAISYTDEQQKSHYYIGMKVRVVFKNGITYGSVSGGTYPKLNINNSGAIPLLAQGKTMASGACSAGQTLEFTLIPYDNGVAWDADSNVRESTSDYTIHTDGQIDNVLNNYIPKSILHGTNFSIVYSLKLSDYGLTDGGNGFIISFINTNGFEYLQFALQPLSNDYTSWKPIFTVQVRVKNPSLNNWLDWKMLSSVYWE